jgi:exonuclease III
MSSHEERTPSSNLGDRTELKIFSLNVQGSTSEKLKDLLQLLNKGSYNIGMFHETKTHLRDWKTKSLQTPHWVVFPSCDNDPIQRQKGTVIFIHESISGYCTPLETPEHLKGRVSLLKIWNKGKPSILLISVYAPPTKKERDEFFRQLTPVLDKYANYVPLLVGDLNAYFSEKDSLSKSTRHSNTLNKLMQDHQLIDTFRTLYPNVVCYTWYRHNSKKNRTSATRIDHIITTETLLPLEVEIIQTGIPTDHMAIAATIPWGRKPNKTPPVPKTHLPYKRTFSPEQRQVLNDKLKPILNDIKLSDPFVDIGNVLLKAATEANPANSESPKIIFKERGLKIKEYRRVTKIIKKLINKRPLNDKEKEYVSLLQHPRNPMDELVQRQKKLRYDIKKQIQQ